MGGEARDLLFAKSAKKADSSGYFSSGESGSFRLGRPRNENLDYFSGIDSAAVHREGRAAVEVQSQLQFCGIGHSAGIPRRIKDDLGVHFPYVRQLRELAFDIGA